MKAFGGGDLLDASMSPAGVALTVNQCIHYALTRPAVATVLSGAHTLKELEISAAYETAAEKGKGLCSSLCTDAEHQLGRTLYVLRSLCAVPSGYRCGFCDQISKFDKGTGDGSRNGKGALQRIGTGCVGMHRLRSL